jgi:ABC-type branched-subunit amino acid transport system permease subunit
LGNLVGPITVVVVMFLIHLWTVSGNLTCLFVPFFYWIPIIFILVIIVLFFKGGSLHFHRSFYEYQVLRSAWNGIQV